MKKAVWIWVVSLCLVNQLLVLQTCQAAKNRLGNTNISQAKVGKSLFLANGCMDCHSINGRGCTEGVSLSSVGLRRNSTFLKQHLADPEEHVKKNQRAFNSEPNLMTNPNLTKREVNLIVTYLQTLKKPVPKKGQKAKYYNTL